MAVDAGSIPELDQKKYDADEQVKIICLGDSAVGKSKWVLAGSSDQQHLSFPNIVGFALFSFFRRLMERFLMDE